MKVILKEEVDNLGYAGDVVDVAAGYGRNYLIPRGMAIHATRGALKEAETLTRARKKREAATVDDARERKDAIEARTLRVEKRVDEKGHLYGSVGAGDIEEVLRARGYEVERRRIDLPRNIKEIGEYQVTVHLHPQVDAEVTIEVVDLEGEVTLESLEAEREAARAETLEERALEAAEEFEAEEEAAAEEAEEEAAEEEAGAVAETEAAEAEEAEAAPTDRPGETMTAAEEALLAQAAAPSEVEQVTIESEREPEQGTEEEPEES